jgi:hypothetical protein
LETFCECCLQHPELLQLSVLFSIF